MVLPTNGKPGPVVVPPTQGVGNPNGLSPVEIQGLILVYNETRSIRKAADAVGTTWNTARRHILRQAVQDKSTFVEEEEELQAYRRDAERQLLDKILETRMRLVRAIASNQKIREARMGELAHAFSILTDKAQLLMGQPTNRSEQIVKSPSEIEERLSPSDMAMLETLRTKLMNDGDESAVSTAFVETDVSDE